MMRTMRLSELQLPLQGMLRGVDDSFNRVCIDSRKVSSGDIFVALRGGRFDGHNFLDEVSSARVPAILSTGSKYNLSWLEVEDTQSALGRLGRLNRELFSGFVAAVTGSSGKTTVKNLVISVLSQKANTTGSKGNFNNEIGVPLTLLDITPSHEFAVIEMGAGKTGDIEYLCQLVQPNAAVALNAMPAHLEGLGNLDLVVSEKGSIYDSLPSDGVAIINNDDPASEVWRRQANSKLIMDFSVRDARADVFASNLQLNGIEGSHFRVNTRYSFIDINLKLPGVHNVSNALAAVCFGLSFKVDLIDIAAGLESAPREVGRLTRYSSPSGALVIDDSYNANPGSAQAAIDVLCACGGRTTLILGSMQELGPESVSFHRRLGRYAKEKGIKNFWGLGKEVVPAVEAFGRRGRWFASRSDLISSTDNFEAGDTILVKGSRAESMEKIVEALINREELSC